MAQFNRVERAERSPGYCMCCGGATGPFVDLSIPYVKVMTAVGILDAEGGTYLCIGTDENPGCAVQIGRLTQLLVDRVDLEAAGREIHELSQANDDLRDKLKGRSVKIEDLIRLGVVTSASSAEVTRV